MSLIPSTTLEKPSNSETSANALDPKTMTSQIEAAMNDAESSKDNSAAEQTKAGVAQAASEVEKAANKLYEEKIEGEYSKREGGA